MGKMVREDKSTWKANYFTKIIQLLDEYPKCFLVEADNVGSKQMQQIRIALRGHAVVLMGKNTMMRKAIRGHLSNNPQLELLLPHIKGNIGFVFTKEDLVTIRDMVLGNKVKAPARAGALAPLDVQIPAQNTGLGPEKTSFFQALNIPTKITKGTIEIISDVDLIKTGDKVGMSESTLLNITDDDLKKSIMTAVRNVAAISLTIGYPTIASVPHSIVNGMKNCMAIAAVTDITFEEAKMLKEYLADPSKFAVAAAPAAAAGGAAPAAEAKKEESAAEESDDDMGFGLFD